MSELVDVALPHEWTPDDLALLPDDGHRYEVVDGVLLVSPPPMSHHQICASRIHQALASAAPAGLEVLEGVGVDLGESMFIPDISVVLSSVALRNVALFKPSEVVLAVEIVSRSSVSIDRILKPARYAEAGIPAYWRVELRRGDRPPSIVVHELSEGRYQEVADVGPGEIVRVERPFRVVLDPARLIP